MFALQPEQVRAARGLLDWSRTHLGEAAKLSPTTVRNFEQGEGVYEAILEAKELAQTDYVIEYNGKPTRAIKKAFSRLCEVCGIKASPHALRHTAATWLVVDGVPLAEVSRLLGDSEKTVETVYGKHSPDYLRRAVNSLNFKRRDKPVLQL